MPVNVCFPGDKFATRLWGNQRLPVVGDTWLHQGIDGRNLLRVKEVTWHDSGGSVSEVTIFLEDTP